jgi:CelD/BcsL family acetyltransferase involved in cellulose biosynthesis
MSPSLKSGGATAEQTPTAFRPPAQQGAPARRSGGSNRGSNPAVQRIEWIDQAERFAELSEPWDRLAAKQRAPFGRHAWFQAWWDAFGTEGKLSICAVWRGQRLAAVLPLWRSGDALRAMSNVHTPIFQVPACDDLARETAISAAAQAAPGELEVEALASTDSALGALAKRSRDAGRLALVESLHSSPIIDLSGGFGSYAQLHPNRCRKLAKLGRKLLRDHHAEITLVESPSDLDSELDRALELEAAGWKGAAGTAILSAPETARFYRSLASAYHRVGELRMSTITLDGQLAAFDLCLLHGGRLWTLKGAYRESHRRLSPGMVLLLWEIERSCELGLEAIELLGGDDQYKLGFASSQRDHVRFRAYRGRPAPLARFAYRRWARPVLKQGHRRLPGQGRAHGPNIRRSGPWRGRTTVSSPPAPV